MSSMWMTTALSMRGPGAPGKDEVGGVTIWGICLEAYQKSQGPHRTPQDKPEALAVGLPSMRTSSAPSAGQ